MNTNQAALTDEGHRVYALREVYLRLPDVLRGLPIDEDDWTPEQRTEAEKAESALETAYAAWESAAETLGTMIGASMIHELDDITRDALSAPQR